MHLSFCQINKHLQLTPKQRLFIRSKPAAQEHLFSPCTLMHFWSQTSPDESSVHSVFTTHFVELTIS